MPLPKYTRREFCVTSTGVLSLTAITTALTGCAGNPAGPDGFPGLATISATIVNSGIMLTVDANSPLAAVGNAALIAASGQNFLVARTGDASFTALTAVCTHQRCTVNTYQNQVFECPCHGSQYSTSGAVLRGPAPAALRQFPTAFANGVLTITLA